ncbi:MAG: hypothetical protein ACRD12_18580 [Acidimicrobiales bacterium]
MRRQRVVRRLRGELLCIEADADGVTIDGIVAADGVTVLLTLSFGVKRRTIPDVVAVLRRWERASAVVDILIGDGPRGQQVKLSAADGKMVLTARE